MQEHSDRVQFFVSQVTADAIEEGNQKSFRSDSQYIVLTLVYHKNGPDWQ